MCSSVIVLRIRVHTPDDLDPTRWKQQVATGKHRGMTTWVSHGVAPRMLIALFLPLSLILTPLCPLPGFPLPSVAPPTLSPAGELPGWLTFHTRVRFLHLENKSGPAYFTSGLIVNEKEPQMAEKTVVLRWEAKKRKIYSYLKWQK